MFKYKLISSVATVEVSYVLEGDILPRAGDVIKVDGSGGYFQVEQVIFNFSSNCQDKRNYEVLAVYKSE